MPHHPEVSKSILIRDLLVFNLKLWMDGLKDLLLAPLSIGAGVLDILSGTRGQRSRFYSIVRLGERFDLWLDLYSPTEQKAQLAGRASASDEYGAEETLDRRRGTTRGSPPRPA